MLKQNSDLNNDLILASIDKIDIQIIKQLIKGDNNKEISFKLKIPLSTVQRRAKKIVDNKLVIPSIRLNRDRFGYHSGLIHVYSLDGNIKETAKKVLQIDGISSVEIHIGNSDILADFAYKDSMNLFEVIIKIKKMEGIEKVIWSERISRIEEKEDDYLLLNR
ncbi:MAG: hypothetical protein ACTHJ7_08800 [Candidatus Nitrosocosmicus sp.]